MIAARFRCAAIVTDIEGTTGSIAFVHDVLFPYARDHLADFVERRRADPRVAHVLRETARTADEPDADEARTIEILLAWMREDRKATPLKTLQGLVWAEGYARGELLGHIYPDALAGLQRWHALHIALYVYSSGSIAAQKLLFGCSTAGDVTALFRGFFDTTSGAKTDVAAYRRIAAGIRTAPPEILFLSDREVELDAARSAGWQVACLARPNETLAGFVSKHPTFASFAEIDAVH